MGYGSSKPGFELLAYSSEVLLIFGCLAQIIALSISILIDIDWKLGQWLIQPLVSWNGYPSVAVRNKLQNYDFGSGNFEDKDARFATTLAAANAGGIAPGFNASLDAGPNSPGCPTGSTIC